MFAIEFNFAPHGNHIEILFFVVLFLLFCPFFFFVALNSITEKEMKAKKLNMAYEDWTNSCDQGHT